MAAPVVERFGARRDLGPEFTNEPFELPRSVLHFGCRNSEQRVVLLQKPRHNDPLDVIQRQHRLDRRLEGFPSCRFRHGQVSFG
jgi:hypothetical protein